MPSIDRREPPYLQIARHFREQIQGEHLREGDRVPPARQIAAEWGVAHATAAKVLATLRTEGLVRTAPGSGTVVASAQDTPSTSTDTHGATPSTEPLSPPQLHAVVRFEFEAGQLKRLRRAGWQLTGQPYPESVAEHSYRVGILAYMIAHLEGANPDRAATLGLFHDIPEARIGDVPSVGKPYVATPAAQRVIADQVAGLPASLAERIHNLIDEHEGAKRPGATLEARCSRDADKLECLLQAREYQLTGNQLMQPWIDSMAEAVTTETGKRLAATAQELSPAAWWADFAATFGQNVAVHPDHQ